VHPQIKFSHSANTSHNGPLFNLRAFDNGTQERVTNGLV
jgi:hypothetical protein